MTPARRGAPTGEGGGTDCLGVLVVVPGSPPLRAIVRSGATDQVRHVDPPRGDSAYYGRRLSAAVRLFLVR
jgi:hypothetical protein